MPRDWLLVSELADCAETRVWESHGFSESASNVLVASDGSGGSRDIPMCLRQVAFEVATFSLQILSGSSFELQRIGFLRSPGARQADSRAELWGAIQALSRVDETTNARCLMDERYVTKGVAQRGDMECGPNCDLWSILFRLISGRSGKTDVIKVKSHLEDDGPSVIKQNRIAFHHMLANSLADVVAEESAKRLSPDMNLEQKAKWAEHTEVSVAKRLDLVQADIWTKRDEAGDIYELDGLLEPTEVSTLSFSENKVGEIANTEHLLVRLGNGLRCQGCNILLCSQEIPMLEQNTLCPSAEFQGRHLEFPCQEKTARHCFQLTPGRRLSCFAVRMVPNPMLFHLFPRRNESSRSTVNGWKHPQRPFAPVLTTEPTGLIPSFVDMDSGVGGVMQSLGELDSSAVRLQSNLDEPDDWDNADTQHAPLSNTCDESETLVGAALARSVLQQEAAQ